MKKIYIAAIVILTLSCAYYFVIFLPSQKQVELKQAKQVFLFSKQTECKNICEKLYEDDKKSLSDSSIFNPVYSYNSNKNACFYSGGWISTNPNSLTKRVLNCQTNKEVLTYSEINNKVSANFCDTCVGSSDEFNKKEKEFITD